MKINCGEHRKWMELVSLQARLKEGKYEPEEKNEIERRILKLEAELFN